MSLWLILFSAEIGRAEPDEPPIETKDVLPVGFPTGEVDSGARGRYFRVSTTAEPTSLEVEEPFTLTVRITSPERSQRPPHRIDLADLSTFADRFYLLDGNDASPESLPAAVLIGLAAAPLGNAPLLAAAALAPETEWVFVYRLKPKSAEITEVPVFTFAYYDPLSAVETPEKRWHVPYTEAIPLTVRNRAVVAVPVRAPDWAFVLADGDVLARDGPWSPPGVLTLTLLLAAPPLLGLCWYLAWRRLYPDAALRARLNRSRAARRALELLVRARQVPPQLQADVVAAIVAGYLRERLDFPAAEPTPTEVRGYLARLTASDALAKQADAFFQASDAARFQPATLGADLADAAERLIVALEEETSAEGRVRNSLAVMPLLLVVFTAMGADSTIPPDLTNTELAERAQASFAEGKEQKAASDKALPHFRAAAADFEELRRRGASNPTLYRNLGNAHLLADNLGPAILAYRRGLRLSPRDTVLRKGLEEARQRVSYAGGSFGKPAPMRLSLIRADWLFIGAALCYALGWLLLTRWFMLRTSLLLASGVAALMMAAMLSVFVVFLVSGERDESARPLVVIATDGVLLLKGNGTTFPPRNETPINQGVEAQLLFERDGWLQIELSGGEVGWIQAGDAVVD